MDAAEIKKTHYTLLFNANTRKIIYVLAISICLLPAITPPTALLLGLMLAQMVENPFLHLNHKATNWLLKISVVGLGFGMNIFSALNAGREGVLFTMVSIISVLTIGVIAGRYLKVDKKTSFLISGRHRYLRRQRHCRLITGYKGRRKTNIGCIRCHIYT